MGRRGLDDPSPGGDDEGMVDALLPLASPARIVRAIAVVSSPWRRTTPPRWTPFDLCGVRRRATSSVPRAMRGTPKIGVIYSVRSDLPTLTEVAPWERDVPVDEGARLAATVAELIAAAGERS